MEDTADSALDSKASKAVTTLEAMERELKDTQAQVQGLGFFARGFVERDISGATGRGFPEWIAATAQIRQALTPLAASKPAPAARQTLADELPRLAKLRAYLQKAPDKVNMVPAGVLKPAQRSQFLAAVAEQTAQLGLLEAELASITADLAAAG